MSRLKSPPFRPSPVVTVAVAVLVALVGLIPQYLSRTIPDVAFPLWAAGRVLDGATLYVDILEINPPLFIWLDVPLVALARWAGMDPILAFRLAVTGLLVVSVAGVVWVRGGSAARRLGSPTIETLAVVFALFVLPRLDWGEREHLALALMLPWIAVAVRRVEGGEVSRRMALLTGVAAGVGIALKPHFVLVWVGREVAIRLGGSAARRLGPLSGLADARTDGQTDGYGWARADTWAPVVVCVVYLCAAFVLTPEYFPLVRELAGPYGKFIRTTLLETMLGPAPAVALTAIIVALGLRKLVWLADVTDGQVRTRGLRLAAPSTVLLCATAAWSVVALLQLKGFRYHWYPGMALGFLLLCQLAPMARGVHMAFTSRLFWAVGTAAVVTTVVLTSWGAVRQARTPLSAEWDADPSVGPLLEALEGAVQPGDKLAVLSPNMASGFPLTNYLGTVWPLRLSNVWPAVVVYRDDLDAGHLVRVKAVSEMTALESWALSTTAADLVSSDPEWLLMFRAFDRANLPYMLRTNFPEFMRRDRQFDSLLGTRDSIGTVGLYSIWSRHGPSSVNLSHSHSSPVSRESVTADRLPVLAPGAGLGALVFAAALALTLTGKSERQLRGWQKRLLRAQRMADD